MIQMQNRKAEETQPTLKPIGMEKDNIQLEIFRNRSEMEARIILKDTGEIIDRIPVKWKARENKLDYLSVSKIQAYEQCPACFYYQYMAEETKHIDGANFFTRFGTALHEVCEIMMKSVRECGLGVPVDSVLPDAWANAGLTTGVADYDQAKKLLDEYFRLNPPTDRPDYPVLIEEEWRGKLGGVTFGLMIDYAGRYNDDQNHILLRDYKTNRMPYTTADLESSLQLRIYELVLKRHYFPEATKITAGYDLFFHGWQQCPDWSDDDLERAEEYVSVIANRIRTDNVWEEKLNNYCCYRECRHTCATYQNFLKNAQSYFIGVDDTDMEQVNADRIQMTAIEKNAKARKTECDNILKAEIERRSMNNERLIVGDQELSLYSSGKKSYRYHDTKRVLLSMGKEGLLDDCLSIQKTKLDKKLDAATKLQLGGCMETSYASPYIVSKKAK